MIAAASAYGQGAKPNVLFIAVDDLRPELGCYQQPHIKSPNIDRLARRGLVFDRTYCQQAICMSSRASLLSGYRPDNGQIYMNGPLFTHVPDALTLNQHFLNNGYTTVCMGKIYHHSSDYKSGWSRPAFKPKGGWHGRGYLSPESARLVAEYTKKNPNAKRQGMGPAFEAPDVPDNAYPDGMVADHAVKELNRLKDEPFFIAVGFVKPHLPFNAPKKYWDLYSQADIKLADNPFAPKGAPKEAATGWGELRGYHGMPRKGPMPDDLARQLIHGYYACVSYTDALIGKILDELDRLKLTKKTVIIVWGDHGWKLGDHGMWCKHTNFEIDTHVPMIISAPGKSASGRRTSALTEFVDIYPTLCQLAGLELPSHLEGTSMVPLLDNPDLPWKKAAFSQYPRGRTMGYSMRTDRYRYTEWRDLKTKAVTARELYDLQTDPRSNSNAAALSENEMLVKNLAQLLKAGYRAARP
jgi:arylsulfatase A-like enzyme